jgi:site-specific recombinase XerD
MINKYCAEKNIKLNLVLEFNKTFVVRYLDWILYERNNSEVTYNNHLTFITNFINFCISRGWLKENFCAQIKRKKEQEKTRQIFTTDVKEKVRKIKTINEGFYTLCMATYFCFIRRTELTKLKVKDISLATQTITIENSNSKNKKTEIITIPNSFMPLLVVHLKNANNEDFVFGSNEFQPGKKSITPKKISDTWDKFRKQLNIKNEYQFYSLKDTGITDLLNAGVPALKVRNQARHSDIKITEKYTARNKKSDEVVQNSNFNF